MKNRDVFVNWTIGLGLWRLFSFKRIPFFCALIMNSFYYFQLNEAFLYRHLLVELLSVTVSFAEIV